MLTSDLLRVRLKGKEIEPSFVEPDGFVEDATDLLATFEAAAEDGWTRGRLDDEILDLVGDRRDHKVLKGMAKVLLDRSEFEVHAPVPPAELRDKVFRAARDSGPLALERGPLDRPVAQDVLAGVGEALGLSAEEVASGLYADRNEEQRLVSLAAGDANWLVHRYNVALVQAVLLKATRVRVRLVGPSAPRLRQLFRYVKFHELMHEARREGEVVEVVLDGPGSLFRKSTRYGMQLATFFPALLLQECRWTLEAQVLWTRRKLPRRLFLGSDAGLVSHYRDTGAYETRTQKWFVERFEALDSGWTLDDRTLPIDLGGRALVLPDYRFTRGGRTAFLEIVGFWRRQYLERRLDWLARYAPGNLVLAVSRKLTGDKGTPDVPGGVVEFAKVVPAKEVLARIEEVAT